MRITFENFSRIKYVYAVFALIIIVLSAVFCNWLAKQMAGVEKQKMDLWAEATQKMASANENIDYEFLLKVIENNTTIPCLIVDNSHNVIDSRNVKAPDNLKGMSLQRFWKKKIEDYGELHEPIVIHIDKQTNNYIYYDNSILLKRLAYFPYVQWGIIAIFFVSLFIFFSAAKKAEQNRVWVGLSKETAHQLGTPISSLMAWVEVLRTQGVPEDMMVEIEKDVNRLQTIAERFSKVGSVPELKPACLNDVLDNALGYMRKRVSRKIPITCSYAENRPYSVNMCIPLFEWVVENLCKNAVDAMEGKGSISLMVGTLEDNQIYVDVTDTGKGIPKSKYKTVFNPGYTTKKRGWGLGLSLVKRIIEEYHHGKIFVKNSEVGKGTTFRIIMKEGQ